MEELIVQTSRALVIGIGGGGDVIGAIPTRSYLEFLGVETVLGGLTWERKVSDPQPGPRGIKELEGVEQLNEYSALARAGASIKGGSEITEGAVARILEEDVFLLDINGGVEGTARALEDAAQKLGVDLIVGVDVGGDCLAVGGEEGVRSPLADGIMVSALARVSMPSVLGMIGYGSDGELTLDELHSNIAQLFSLGGYLGARGATYGEANLMERCAQETSTEASKLVVEVLRGKRGRVEIRKGSRELYLTPCSAVTFYFAPWAVSQISHIARLVEDTSSLEEANTILRGKGYLTELYLEREG